MTTSSEKRLTSLDDLPLEILHLIAKEDEETYRGVLSVPRFARSLGVSSRLDFMIFFGYSVTINIASIIWYKNCTLHTIWDNAPIIFDSNGIVSYVYYKNGHVHRDNDKPALILLNTLEPAEIKLWYKNGKRHRDNNKPAYIKYKERNYRVKELTWYVNDKEHRDFDLPSTVKKVNGKIKKLLWMKDGCYYERGNDLPDKVKYNQIRDGSVIWILCYCDASCKSYRNKYSIGDYKKNKNSWYVRYRELKHHW